MPPWEGPRTVIDSDFSRVGKPATAFERELLARAKALEDPWVEVAGIIGLDATLQVMDRFASCLLSIPSRDAFVRRLHTVHLDAEVLRLRREGKTNREVADLLSINERSVRKRKARALRGPIPQRA